MSNLSSISKSEIALLQDPNFSHEKSEILCRLAIFSYLETEDDIKKAVGDEWPNFKYWLDSDIENQGFAVWNDNVVVISFRGSNLTLGDWSSNANAFFPKKHSIGGRRHNGFESIWEQESNNIWNFLNDEIAPSSQLWMTGHSLGGALSTAAAAEFMHHPPENINKDTYGVVTFGAPRYGNKIFQEKFDSLMGKRFWFYVNQRDPVPQLIPNWMGYRHVGVLKYFTSEGEHIEISKKEVGLQTDANTPEGKAAKMWQSLEAEVNRFSQSEEELSALIKEMTENMVKPDFKITDNGVQISDLQGGLEGDSFWSPLAHSSDLYWRRVKKLV